MSQPPFQPGQDPLKGRYKLVRQLGHGAMGSVWLAEDKLLSRPVAMKELIAPHGNAELADRRERMVQEARALARVSHPAIVSVHDLFFIGDDPWIVMEYISAPSLAQILSEKSLDERRIARIGRRVLEGLSAVHRADIVHRDVKPSNILVADDSDSFLVDFGIARIVDGPSLTGQFVIGTPEYMAPEQFTPGSRVGPPADVWGLGVTLFQALEGYSPFGRHGHDVRTVQLAIETETPKLASSGPLADITLRMLAKDPAQRATVREATRVLTDILTDAPRRSSASTDPHPVPPAPWPARSAVGAARRPAGPATRPYTERTVRPPKERTAEVNGLRDELLRVGPDTGAALLLKLDVRTSVKILADCPSKRRGELLQAIAVIEPGTAATILRMLLDTTAGSAFAYLRPQTAASLLSAMPASEAVRILTRTDVRTAASTIMELAPAEGAALLESMSDLQRAADVLLHATPETAIAVACAKPDFGRRVHPYLREPLRAQVGRALAKLC